jgi:hypothetical protein
MYRSFAHSAGLMLLTCGVAVAQVSAVDRPFEALDLTPGTAIATVLQRYPAARPDGSATRGANGRIWCSFILPRSTYAGRPAEYHLTFQDSQLVKVRVSIGPLPNAAANEILVAFTNTFTSRFGIPSENDAERIFMLRENYTWHFSGGGPNRLLRLERRGDFPSDSQSVRITERVED